MLLNPQPPQNLSSLQKSFIDQWFSRLPTPFIGLQWREYPPAEQSINILQSMLRVLDETPGSLVILQPHITEDERRIFSSLRNKRVLDCSDIDDKPEELSICLRVLNDFIGIPGKLYNNRNNNSLFCRIIVPNVAAIESLAESNPQNSVAYYRYNNSSEEIDSFMFAAYDCICGNTSVGIRNGVSKSISSRAVSDFSLTDLLTYSAERREENFLIKDTALRINSLSDYFSLASFKEKTKLTAFVYHVDKGQNCKIDYRDIKQDLSAYDYLDVLSTFIASVKRWHPEAHIYVVTNPDSRLLEINQEGVRTIGLPLDTDKTMYERVVAMCAFVHSRAFSGNTLFLDSDAFINANMDHIFEGNFDVAITYRDNQGVMPVNEGVIAARYSNPIAVKAFFKEYAATYDRLKSDPVICAYYGDIEKWRGGQLSLNAITHHLAPYSPYRTVKRNGIQLRCLPTDPYNYSWEYNSKVTASGLANKRVIHVKGARKAVLEQLKPLLHAFWKDATVPAFIEPHFALYNKSYTSPPFSDDNARRQFANGIAHHANFLKANQPGSGAFIADDLFTWFRTLGFLSEADFTNAFAPYATDVTLRARIWRIYLLCWAAKSCLRVKGDFADFGCYDGRTVDVMLRYINFEKTDKKYFLYDLFENPTSESRKAKHGPGLYEEVKSLFSDYNNVQVIKGPLPHTIVNSCPEHIAFAQIDLNEAEPELETLNYIYDRITPGGMVVLDDYGFIRYNASHRLEYEFFHQRGDVVFESPTGQGLFIKR